MFFQLPPKPRENFQYNFYAMAIPSLTSLTSVMSSVRSLAVTQARMDLAKRIAVKAGPDADDVYCDEYGTWVRQDNHQWQLVVPALTSMAMV